MEDEYEMETKNMCQLFTNKSNNNSCILDVSRTFQIVFNAQDDIKLVTSVFGKVC